MIAPHRRRYLTYASILIWTQRDNVLELMILILLFFGLLSFLVNCLGRSLETRLRMPGYGHYLPFPDWLKVTLGLALPASANVAEVFRGAVASIPATQWEAARSLGFGRGQILRTIILDPGGRRMPCGCSTCARAWPTGPPI
ncbi:hypothetical protein SAMN04244574_04463 [Azotobacter beijerinckii]|uniref:Binding-protein-dependent transport system inner membrane component n=1 Tax=Azotobacter beijerinckii TaxID=170623 RepID=A0A1I4I3W2_9GAMM|nr:hypothetical protein SAMN04244571_04575 [Azotobacter beijerinckii]SFL48860.1 hypothetical protein SAMN04244574_04463 [Azotobacter beijerinckii]